jgi:hypothetical protein
MNWKGDGVRMTKGGSPSGKTTVTSLLLESVSPSNVTAIRLGIREKWAGIREDQGEGVGSGRRTP